MATPPNPFVVVPVKDLSRGIDQRSAENAVPDGYCEDILNADVNTSGFIAKRAGYQGYYGYLPVRVKSYSRNANKTTLTLDGSIDISAAPPSSLLVAGLLPAGAVPSHPSDFWSSGVPVFTAVSYPSFALEARDTVAAGAGTITKESFASQYTVAGFALSTSTTDFSYTVVYPDSVTVDQATFELNVGYNNVGAATSGFVYTVDKSPLSGVNYVATFSGAATTITVLGTTSGLASNISKNNVLCRVYKNTGTAWQEIIPDTLQFNAQGDLAVTLAVALGGLGGQVVMWTAPVAQSVTGASPLVIANAAPFALFSCYLSSDKSQIIPASIVYSASAKTYTVTWAGGASLIVVYDYAVVTTNKLAVLDQTALTTTGTDAYPNATTAEYAQLSVWGLNHAVSYKPTSIKGGWVHEIDTYRRTGEARVVAGVGGNLFTARTRAESGTAYNMPSTTTATDVPVASGVVDPIVLGPAFYTTGAAPVRNIAATVKADDVYANAAVVTAVTFNVGTGWVDVKLQLTNKVGTLAAALSVAAGLEDWLTISGVGLGVHNGAFKIKAVNDGTNTISVANAAVTTGDWDGSSLVARAGVFTDRMNTSSAAVNFVPGDVVGSAAFAAVTAVVKSVSVATPAVVVDGLTATVSIAKNRRVGIKRTAAVMPVAAAVQFVPGDMTTVTGLARELRVKAVQPYADIDVTITCAAGVATVSCGSSSVIAAVDSGIGVIDTVTPHGLLPNQPVVFKLVSGSLPARIQPTLTYYVIAWSGIGHDPTTAFYVAATPGGAAVIPGNLGGGTTINVQRVHNVAVGQQVLITQTGSSLLDGVHIITTTADDHTFTFATTSLETLSGQLQGMCIQLDEAIAYSTDLDSRQTVAVTGRWAPAEIPVQSTASTVVPSTAVTHFKTNVYDNQPVTRSASLAENSYFTNGDDEVLKFDGTNVYQAGLFRWQLQAFVSITTDGTNSLPVSQIAVAVSAANTTNQSYTVAAASTLVVGDRYFSGANVYTVRSVDVSNKLATFTMDIGSTFDGGGPGALTKVNRYGYYYRLVAYDVNNNVIASAAVGQRDYLVEQTVAANVAHRLVGFPAWNIYDYSRLYLRVCRTKANVPGVYYIVKQLPVSFAARRFYLDFLDTTPDEGLHDLDDVGVVTGIVATRPADPGVDFEQPPRGKYIASFGKRLVVAHVKDYPQLDLQAKPRNLNVPTAGGDWDKKVFLFLKDATDTGTVSDMASRAKYRFLDRTASAAQFFTVTGVAVAAPGTVGNKTAVVSVTAHGRAVGDWVYLFYNTAGADRHPKFAGWWLVATIVDADNFGVSVYDDGSNPAAKPDRMAVCPIATDIPVVVGVDGNYNYFGANPTSTIPYDFTAMFRLATAINSTTRVWQDHAVAFGLAYTPWMTANAGSEYGLGEMVVRQPKVVATNLAVVLPILVAADKFDIYLSNLLQGSAAPALATTKLFPSRLVTSYQNVPDVFGGPAAFSGTDSIADINPADGQEITAIFPFFGTATFTFAQQDQSLAVFKANSIYLFDIITRNVVRLDTQGLGCTVPYSVASTKNGIMFANDSGVYKLGKDMTISYVGKNTERLWLNSVNHSSLANATGHFYASGRKYKLSVPVGQVANNQVFVYDHNKEGQGQEFGSWVRYDDHPATGWANLTTDAFFGSTIGQVFKIRTVNDKTDYRDDAGPVAMTVVLKAMDFGLSSRKILRTIITEFRVSRSDMKATLLAIATDLRRQFDANGNFNVTYDAVTGHKVSSLRSSPVSNRGMYFQLSYSNAAKDEDVVISGVECKVAPLGTEGQPSQDDGN